MTRGTVVLLHGLIKGPDREAECEVLARRLAAPSGEHAEELRECSYTDCAVVGAPPELPEGEYIVEFAGYNFNATKQKDLWLTRGPASKIQELPQVFEI